LNDAHAALLGIVIEITGRAGDGLGAFDATAKGVGVRHAIAVIM
jgi:hypothetical protein